MRGKCKTCGTNVVRGKGLRNGKTIYGHQCSTCHKKRYGIEWLRPYTRHKKDRCELCGFVAKHPAQLDVDHVDGNGLNHDSKNLQTLCANCHRLKTVECRDHCTPRVKVKAASQLKLI